MIVTAEEIEAKKTPKGAWTKKQLEEWGVPWPPPAGWKRALISGSYPTMYRIGSEVELALEAIRNNEPVEAEAILLDLQKMLEPFTIMRTIVG